MNTAQHARGFAPDILIIHRPRPQFSASPTQRRMTAFNCQWAGAKAATPEHPSNDRAGNEGLRRTQVHCGRCDRAWLAGDRAQRNDRETERHANHDGKQPCGGGAPRQRCKSPRPSGLSPVALIARSACQGREDRHSGGRWQHRPPFRFLGSVTCAGSCGLDCARISGATTSGALRVISPCRQTATGP